MGTGTTRVHDTFWNTLMVKMRDFFTQNKIFKQCRPAAAALERILIVGNGQALIGSEEQARRGLLMRFAAVSLRSLRDFRFFRGISPVPFKT